LMTHLSLLDGVPHATPRADTTHIEVV
jgi:hypothetical protein